MNASLPPLPTGIGTLTDEQAQALNQREAAARKSVAHCVTCGGHQTFAWYAPASTEVITYDCPCRDQYRLSRWLWNSGVMLRYQRLRWHDLYRTDFAGAEVYADYLINSAAYTRVGLGLVMYGPRGTGKSLIGNLVVKDLIRLGMDCHVTTFEDMVTAYTGGWDDAAKERWFNARMNGADVLMIDDLGRERRRGNWTVAENMLEAVVRHRVACQMPTIFTTNLDPTSPASLEAAYGGHTISLLTECSLLCEVDGPDARTMMRSRDQDEAVRGLMRPVVLG